MNFLVPVWVQWVFSVGTIATALTAILILFRKLWPALTTFVKTVNALGDLPEFMINTAHALADQDEAALVRDQKIEEIHHEVQYNNGSSVKDAIKRVEEGVAGLYTRAEIDAKNKVLTDELEATRPKPVRPPRKKPL